MANDDSSALARVDPWEKFALQLEQRMLAGEGDRACFSWAVNELGVPVEKYRQVRAMILSTWEDESKSRAEVCTERAELRAMYIEIHRRALEQNKLDTGIKALDSVVHLRGLALGEKATGGGDVNVNVAVGITNDARGVLADLTEKMRERVQGKTMVALREYNERKQSTKLVGKNGNGKIIDVDDDLDEDDEDDE